MFIIELHKPMMQKLISKLRGARHKYHIIYITIYIHISICIYRLNQRLNLWDQKERKKNYLYQKTLWICTERLLDFVRTESIFKNLTLSLRASALWKPSTVMKRGGQPWGEVQDRTLTEEPTISLENSSARSPSEPEKIGLVKLKQVLNNTPPVCHSGMIKHIYPE